MDIYSGQIFTIIWIGWIVSWLAAAFWSAPTEKRGARAEAWIYRTVMLVGSILLWPQTGRAFNEDRLWLVGYGGAYALAALAFAGLVFTWWARIHLGRLWSGTITRKQDHRIVETGPYALVRHPIYTGLIAAIVATAVAEATVAAIVGAVLAAFGLWLKARIEERFLAGELGADAYDAYRRRVPMLVPFLRPRGS
ncbi:MAG: isoprenylcysteine carboxylmethyltransferase family protein [Xanthobacteraceae bacterium]